MPYFGGLFFVGVGVFFFCVEKNQRRICTAQTEGVILDEGLSYKYGKKRYRPTFSYLVEDAEYTIQKNFAHNTKKVSEGQAVTVFYNPSKPQQNYVFELRVGNGGPAIFVAIGMGLIIIELISRFAG